MQMGASTPASAKIAAGIAHRPAQPAEQRERRRSGGSREQRQQEPTDAAAGGKRNSRRQACVGTQRLHRLRAPPPAMMPLATEWWNVSQSSASTYLQAWGAGDGA